MPAVIETENLTKKFGKFKALDSVTLSVKRGEIYGFLGLNGAGKTTTIKSLLGLVWPDSGSVFVCGNKISRKTQGPWSKVGSLVETPAAYPELTVRQNLEIFRRLRGLPDKPDPVSAIIDKLSLSRYSEKKARDLSLGNHQRLGLAKAMIHNPEVLILDEPANGLDPVGIVEIRGMLTNLARNNNVTVFVSSHHLEEISKTADRLGIIHNGRLMQEITSSELEKMRNRSFRIYCRQRNLAVKILEKAGYEIVSQTEENAITLPGNLPPEKREEIVSLLSSSDAPPYEMKIVEEDLETYFLRIIAESKK